MSKIERDALERLTNDLLTSYRGDDRTHRIGERFLPKRERVVAVLHEIFELLFPGYFGQNELTEENLQFRIGSLLDRLSGDLALEISNCLCVEKSGDCTAEECRSRAETIAFEFLRRLPRLREMLAMDVQAAFDGDPAAKSLSEVIYCYPGFYAVCVYRIAHELLELGVGLMPRIMTEHAHSVTGCDIHPGATIGKSFFIDHATGVVIGETTHIGDNVKIYQGVTLGALSFPKDERGRVIKGLQRHPTVEDNATIYANATILGGETVIGKGVAVGGNTFITASIDADSTVTLKAPEHNIRKKTPR